MRLGFTAEYDLSPAVVMSSRKMYELLGCLVDIVLAISLIYLYKGLTWMNI